MKWLDRCTRVAIRSWLKLPKDTPTVLEDLALGEIVAKFLVLQQGSLLFEHSASTHHADAPQENREVRRRRKKRELFRFPAHLY